MPSRMLLLKLSIVDLALYSVSLSREKKGLLSLLESVSNTVSSPLFRDYQLIFFSIDRDRTIGLPGRLFPRQISLSRVLP